MGRCFIYGYEANYYINRLGDKIQKWTEEGLPLVAPVDVEYVEDELKKIKKILDKARSEGCITEKPSEAIDYFVENKLRKEKVRPLDLVQGYNFLKETIRKEKQEEYELEIRKIPSGETFKIADIIVDVYRDNEPIIRGANLQFALMDIIKEGANRIYVE